MNHRKFYFREENYVILATIKTFIRTKSGKSWKSKPESIEKKVFSAKNYENYVTSVPFFNNYGFGAYCRCYCYYTEAGYIPAEIITVSPFRKKKEIITFRFISKSILLDSAGWREKEIVENAKRFDVEIHNGSQMIHFYTEGVLSKGTFDTKTSTWRN